MQLNLEPHAVHSTLLRKALLVAQPLLLETVNLGKRGKSSKSPLIGGLVGGIVGGCLLVAIIIGLWNTKATACLRPWGSRMPSRVNTRELTEVERGPMDRGY